MAEKNMVLGNLLNSFLQEVITHVADQGIHIDEDKKRKVGQYTGREKATQRRGDLSAADVHSYGGLGKRLRAREFVATVALYLI